MSESTYFRLLREAADRGPYGEASHREFVVKITPCWRNGYRYSRQHWKHYGRRIAKAVAEGALS